MPGKTLRGSNFCQSLGKSQRKVPQLTRFIAVIRKVFPLFHLRLEIGNHTTEIFTERIGDV